MLFKREVGRLSNDINAGLCPNCRNELTKNKTLNIQPSKKEIIIEQIINSKA